MTKESAFESSIEAHLLAHGWGKVSATAYDVGLGLFPDELVAFLAASQPDEWQDLCAKLGGEPSARVKVVKRVADEITARGVVDVLRGVVKLNGVAFRVAFFAPANGLTPALWERYGANRLGVVRQLHHSESKPGTSVDLALVVNGIPTATAELKNPLTQQSVGDAMEQ
ncbi:MAG: type I restriction endonuclease, partial [Candidatus Phosphoribacter sp.]